MLPPRSDPKVLTTSSLSSSVPPISTNSFDVRSRGSFLSADASSAGIAISATNKLPNRILRDVDAHAPSRTFNAADRRLQIEAVEIGHLDLRDLLNLLLSNPSDLVLVRLGRTLGQ